MANRVMAQKRMKMARQRRAWAKAYQSRAPKPPNREAIRHYADHARGLGDNQFVDSAPPEIPVKKQAQALLELALPVGCDLKFVGPTVPDIYQETFIYFNAKRTQFVLVLRDLEQNIERVSTVYSSKELLMMCWGMGRVYWVGKHPIV